VDAGAIAAAFPALTLRPAVRIAAIERLPG
jgi:hypothetical protein